jgi:phenylalanyl-tRNA synthetase alpha chain
MSDLEDILSTALSAVATAGDAPALDDVRVKYLGKKGELTGLLKGLGKLSPEKRPAAGAEINTGKEALQEAISARKADLDNAAIDAQLASETIDVSLPGRNMILVRSILSPRYFAGWKTFSLAWVTKW